MLNHLAIGNRKLEIKHLANGEIRTPHHLESFRGCSTPRIPRELAVSNDKSQAVDFSLRSMRAQCFVPRLAWPPFCSRKLRCFRQGAQLYAYDRAGVAQCGIKINSRCNVGRLILAGCKSRPYESARGEIRTPDQGLMSPLLCH
jgi:hypothetical protein